MDTKQPPKIGLREDIMGEEYKKIQEERMLEKESKVPDYPDELNRADYGLPPENNDSEFKGGKRRKTRRKRKSKKTRKGKSRKGKKSRKSC